MANKRRDPARERVWRGVLRRFVTSGWSVRAFCRHERLSEPSFYAWRRTIAERDNQAQRTSARRKTPGRQPSFLPVLISGGGAASGALSIELAGGRVLRLPEAIPAGRLAELVAALEATCVVARSAR